MTIVSLLLVAAGGFLGAAARYGVGAWVNRKFPAVLPRATLGVNLTGSFLLGLLAGANGGEGVGLFLGTGFMGAYTTFSTLNVELTSLARRGAWKVWLGYLAATYGFGIALAYAGYGLGSALN